jgi:hypothetical protein
MEMRGTFALYLLLCSNSFSTCGCVQDLYGIFFQKVCIFNMCQFNLLRTQVSPVTLSFRNLWFCKSKFFLFSNFHQRKGTFWTHFPQIFNKFPTLDETFSFSRYILQMQIKLPAPQVSKRAFFYYFLLSLIKQLLLGASGHSEFITQLFALFKNFQLR